jgi:hypothetical protein
VYRPRIKRFAKGRKHKPPGTMNCLEKSYSKYLDARMERGEIIDWKFNSLKLRLADRTYLTVDFWVMLEDGTLEAHETKGFMEADAAVKLKVAAEQYWWFRFYLVKAIAKKRGGGFDIRRISQ